MKQPGFFLVNAITGYRVLASLALFLLAGAGRLDWFQWLLPLSFFTDLIDGPLSRKLNVSSTFGAYLDSIGDDLTVLAGIYGVYVFKNGFLHDFRISIAVMVSLFIAQILFALIRYGKLSSFHTYLAKVAAIVQGSFLILLFLLPEPIMPLYWLAVAITVADLLEEILLVALMKTWRTNVKGLYWVLNKKSDKE
ncbi:MAG: CDP-alcohol phosphatidyltransferase family protein [Bacteroidota bacterium]